MGFAANKAADYVSQGKSMAEGALGSAISQLPPEAQGLAKLLTPGPKNPRVTPEFALKYPEFKPHIGERLDEHHLGQGSLTYPLPVSAHKGQSPFFHGVPTRLP